MLNVQISNRIAVMTLNRPEKRNALNDELAKSILDNLILLKDNIECKVLIIRANGEAFCAGADLGYLQKLQSNSYEENLQDSTALMNMFKALYEFPKVTIAQVEGPALAGGCGLAGLCDFVYATPEASFGYTEVKIGFIPAIVSVFLAPKIGENAAKSLLLTGTIIDATKAMEIQIVNEVFQKEMITEKVDVFAKSIVNGTSAQSIELTKKLLLDIKGKPLEEQLFIASQANAAARSTDDCKKGISSFLNKEKIVW